MTLEGTLLQLLGFQVVEREGNLLVFVILIIVVERQVGLLLGCNHTFHELNGRIVLTAIVASLRLHRHLGKHLLVGLQLDIQTSTRLGCDSNDARLIAYGTERDVPSLMAVNLILTIVVGDGSDVMAFIDHTGKGDGIACLSISDGAVDLLGEAGEIRQHTEQKY